MNREEAVAYVLAIIERADAPTAAAAIVDGGFLTVSELDETLAAFFDSAQPPAAAQAPVRPMSFVSFRWSPRRVDIRIGRFTCSSSSLVEAIATATAHIAATPNNYSYRSTARLVGRLGVDVL